ncbi:MAG: hypothetical protein SFY66_10530 [Oculatellaceae cyanobacterium bins.114]|nr:hypothetical protein [Oculatellaceae cyanobacterium bins.114]
MSNEQHDESLGVEQVPQDELEASPPSEQNPSQQAIPLTTVDMPPKQVESLIDAEASRDSKQPRREERDRRIATD